MVLIKSTAWPYYDVNDGVGLNPILEYGICPLHDTGCDGRDMIFGRESIASLSNPESRTL
jgi:hypothetical protein